MLKSFLKIAWRNILRTKGYSLLNILGLTTGMAVALLIGLWVQYEFSYDRFLPANGQLFQVARNFDNNGDSLTFTSTSLKLADKLRNTIPGLDIAEARIWNSYGLKVGDRKLYLEGSAVNANFLEMFEYPLVEGTPKEALKEPFSIVLTESLAKSLFGSEDPMEKTVRLDNKNDLKVSGVLRDIPGNSSFSFKFIIPFSYLEATNDGVKRARGGGYGWNAFQIFARLKPGASLAQVRQSIGPIEHTDKDNINAMKSTVILEPMRQWHLWGDYKNGKPAGGFIEYVRMFSIIGFLVLVIACINFVNLETARSEKRAREVGVRKAIGSQRSDLIFQFLTESFLLTLIAFILALVLAASLLPWFNTLAVTDIHFPWSDPLFWTILIAAVVATALMSGARPAFYLSSFNPVRVLKGLFKTGKQNSLPRKILVVIQFTASIALIISTIIVYQQIQYARNRPTGFDKDRLLVTEMNEDLGRNYTALQNELLSNGVVDKVTSSSSPATEIDWHSDVDKWPGKLPNETVEMGTLFVGDNYFKTMGMSIVAGRAFEGPQDTLSFVLNETAVRRLRLKQPIETPIEFQGIKGRIIGVVRDAMILSPFSAADPTLFGYGPNPHNYLIYHLNPHIGTQAAISQLSAVFNKYEPDYPYKYDFVDQEYATKFNLEILIGKLSGIFAALAIFISCLGLFGLAAYMAEQRTKEIGIRKVLGASITQVWVLLSKDFISLVLLSALVASPIAYYFLNRWLIKYDYRIHIQPTVFLVAGGGALLITLITVSFQSVKAALTNPVKSLRSE